MSEYLCNLVVPGFPKCGTTSFHKLLAQHPEICMSRPKEPHFFAREGAWQQGPRLHNSFFAHRSGSETLFGDSSTIYCVSESALHRISESLTDPRVILLLRDPVERTISHYLWLHALGIERRSLRTALSEESLSFDPARHERGFYKYYLLFSLYSRFIPRWTGAFGPRNLAILTTERLRARPQDEMARIFRFLGLDPLRSLTPVRTNVTEEQLPLSHPTLGWRLGRLTLPKRLRRRWRRSQFARNVARLLHKAPAIAPVSISPEDRQMVLDYLRPERAYFEEILGRQRL